MEVLALWAPASGLHGDAGDDNDTPTTARARGSSRVGQEIHCEIRLADCSIRIVRELPGIVLAMIVPVCTHYTLAKLYQ